MDGADDSSTDDGETRFRASRRGLDLRHYTTMARQVVVDISGSSVFLMSRQKILSWYDSRHDKTGALWWWIGGKRS